MVILIENSIVNNFLFASKTDILADEAQCGMMRHNSNELLKGCYVNKFTPWIPDFLESLPLWISKPIMPPPLIDLLNLFDVSHPRCLSVKL
jgi:hypothetical protein